MGKMLTDEQIASWHRDGFLVPVDFMSEVEALGQRLEECALPDACGGDTIVEGGVQGCGYGRLMAKACTKCRVN